MPLTQLENELRLQARTLIEQDRLPCENSARLWGGYGREEPCSVCGRPIQRDEVKYEIEIPVHGHAHLYPFHFLCHAAWQLECARVSALKAKSASP